MRNIIPVLKSLGLLESEVKTYLAALELGPSTVLEINKKIGLSRQAIYTAIESLIELGLMSSVEKGKKTLFTAESPERLRSFAEAKLKKMESTVREIKDITKDLTLMQQGEKPVVKMFEGKEGIISIHNDISQTKPEQIDDFVNNDAMSKLISDEDVKHLKERLDKLQVKTRALVASNEPPIELHRRLKKIIHIDNKDINFDGDIAIYGNKVALTSLKGKIIGVIIENPTIAQTMRALFELAWQGQNKKAR